MVLDFYSKMMAWLANRSLKARKSFSWQCNGFFPYLFSFQYPKIPKCYEKLGQGVEYNIFLVKNFKYKITWDVKFIIH